MALPQSATDLSRAHAGHHIRLCPGIPERRLGRRRENASTVKDGRARDGAGGLRGQPLIQMLQGLLEALLILRRRRGGDVAHGEPPFRLQPSR